MLAYVKSKKYCNFFKFLQFAFYMYNSANRRNDMQILASKIICRYFIYLTGGVNLAVNKPADQIDTWANNPQFGAYKAVNGITDDISDFTFTRTSNGIKWWKVDLEAKYTIGRILLYNSKYSAPAGMS